MNQIIVLWSTCRSRSTAFERIMLERGDLHVFHEPFGKYFYFSKERGVQRAEHIKPKPEYDFEYIINTVLNKAEKEPIFMKEQAFQAGRKITTDILKQFSNSFLLRHPKEVIPSMHHKMPDFTLEELGYEALHTLFEKSCQLTDKNAIVVDSSDFIANPKATIQAYCHALGIPFIADALSWDARLPEQFVWWDGGSWLDDVAKSTSIQPTNKSYTKIEESEFLQQAYEHAMPYYNELLQHKLDIKPFISI